MKTFKCLDDVQRLPLDHPAHAVVLDMVMNCIVPYDTPRQPYRPEDEGYVVLIEEGDQCGPLIGIWDDWGLLNIPWEGIFREGRYFIGIFLANNEFGLVFIIPDEPWIEGELRRQILDNLDP